MVAVVTGFHSVLSGLLSSELLCVVFEISIMEVKLIVSVLQFLFSILTWSFRSLTREEVVFTASLQSQK